MSAVQSSIASAFSEGRAQTPGQVRNPLGPPGFPTTPSCTGQIQRPPPQAGTEILHITLQASEISFSRYRDTPRGPTGRYRDPPHSPPRQVRLSQ